MNIFKCISRLLRHPLIFSRQDFTAGFLCCVKIRITGIFVNKGDNYPNVKRDSYFTWKTGTWLTLIAWWLILLSSVITALSAIGESWEADMLVHPVLPKAVSLSLSLDAEQNTCKGKTLWLNIVKTFSPSVSQIFKAWDECFWDFMRSSHE